MGVETRDGAPGWVRLLAFLWKPTLLLRPDLEANQTLFDIEMPRCEECQKDEPLVPEHVDEAHHRMTFVVVRDFKERLDRSPRGG